MLFVKFNLINIGEVAKKLVVSKFTVIKWVKSGFLISGKNKNPRGGHPIWDITQEDLDIYLNKLNG